MSSPECPGVPDLYLDPATHIQASCRLICHPDFQDIAVRMSDCRQYCPEFFVCLLTYLEQSGESVTSSTDTVNPTSQNKLVSGLLIALIVLLIIMLASSITVCYFKRKPLRHSAYSTARQPEQDDFLTIDPEPQVRYVPAARPNDSGDVIIEAGAAGTSSGATEPTSRKPGETSQTASDSAAGRLKSDVKTLSTGATPPPSSTHEPSLTFDSPDMHLSLDEADDHNDNPDGAHSPMLSEQGSLIVADTGSQDRSLLLISGSHPRPLSPAMVPGAGGGLELLLDEDEEQRTLLKVAARSGEEEGEISMVVPVQESMSPREARPDEESHSDPT